MTKKHEIKKIAIAMVKEKGLINLSRKLLCEKAGIPDGSFPHVMDCTFAELQHELTEMNIVSINVTTVSKRRVSPELRRDHILSVAIDIAEETGYDLITRVAVAEKAGVSQALVSKYFGTMGQLKNAVIRYAVKNQNIIIIGQMIIGKHLKVKTLPKELKKVAVEFLAREFLIN